mmetsp:Transcript_12572/g.16265  ORF Transcript_12572/g.16265 Transcript_12572/m.16265 type:complete len:133 (+) Transcript_12572:62-460(+)
MDSLSEIKQRMRKFATDRDWNKFHTPRNILLALVGEVGELSEIFQWKNEVKEGLPSFSEEEKVHTGEELADVLLYLVRLADRCDIDLSQAVEDKFAKNVAKYPAELVKGSSKKYTEYRINADSKENASSNGE